MQTGSPSTGSVFLGGIPPEATLQDLREAISIKVGTPDGWLLELKGKSDKCSHLGFGFVHCDTEGVANIFRNIPFFLVKGKKVECKEGWSIEEHKKRTNLERQVKIFVSCIKKNTKKNVIMDYFSSFGPVVDVVIGKDKSSGRKLGFCIVEFESETSVMKVLATDAHKLENKEIKCQKMLLKHELNNNKVFKPKNEFSSSTWNQELKFQTSNLQKPLVNYPENMYSHHYKKPTSNQKPNYGHILHHGIELTEYDSPKAKHFLSNSSYHLPSKHNDSLKFIGSHNEFRYLPRKPAQTLNYMPQHPQFPIYGSAYSLQCAGRSPGAMQQGSPATTQDGQLGSPHQAYLAAFGAGRSEQKNCQLSPADTGLQFAALLSDDPRLCSPLSSHHLPFGHEPFIYPQKFDKSRFYNYPQSGPIPTNSYGSLSKYSLPVGLPGVMENDHIVRASEGNVGKPGGFKGRNKLPLKPNSLSSLPGPLESP